MKRIFTHINLYFQNLDDDLGSFLGSMPLEIWIGENSAVFISSMG